MATDFDALLNARTRYTGRWFSKDSFVNRRLPDKAPIDRDSAKYVNTLANRGMPSRIQEPGNINAAGYTFFGWWYSSYTLFVVDRSDPDSYTLEDFQMDRTAQELSGMTTLVEAFKQVPVPVDARPSPHYTSAPNTPGHDNIMMIYDPGTDSYWETWHTNDTRVDGPKLQDPRNRFTANVPQATMDIPGWHFGYGGAMKNMTHGPGYFTNNAWNGAGAGWGASAGKICVPTGMITRTEAVNAVRDSTPIPHIIGVGIAIPHYSKFRWPAATTDGASTDPWAPQYGMIYRFPPGYDVDSITDDPFITEICRAIRDYGLLIREYAGGITFTLENGNTTQGENPLQRSSPSGLLPHTAVPGYSLNQFRDDIWLGEDNTTGANHDGIFTDQPTKIGDSIPYLDLQVLDVTYRPTSPVKSRLAIGVP